MDTSFYKDITVSRGLQYHYFSSPAQKGKLTILFVHGFPNTSGDWRHQVSFFRARGYGVIVPDMLGYGGTAKPLETSEYVYGKSARDLVDIVDAEKVEKIIAIGHDWGSQVVSRLADSFEDRFIAFGFLCAGYMAARPVSNFKEILVQTKAAFGYELYGYMDFFSSPRAADVLAAHTDSALTLLYCKDASLWAKNMAPLGCIEPWITEDNILEHGDYISKEELETQKKAFLEQGWAAPLNWYKVFTSGLDVEADKGISPDFVIKKPVFFGGAAKDYICIGAMHAQITTAHAIPELLSVRHYDAGHWVILEAKDELNKDLLTWIEGLGVL